MSCYIYYEIVIKSKNRESVINAMNAFEKRNYCGGCFDFTQDIKHIEDDYILIQSSFDSHYITEELFNLAGRIARKHGCQIEIITESIEANYSEHYYHDGKKAIHKGGVQRCYDSWIGDRLTIEGYYIPFISKLSEAATEAFKLTPSLLEKWFGFHLLTLDAADYYIGRGYDNTDRYIDLSLYNKSEDNCVKERKVLDNGKKVLTYDFDDHETLYEYDDNANLIYKKVEGWVGELEETWYKYNKEGKLVEERDSSGEKITYSYDNQGNLIQKKCFQLILYDDFDVFDEDKKVEFAVNKNSNEKIYSSDDNKTLLHKEEDDDNRYYVYENEIYSYDDNGTLIYTKDDYKESWYNTKGELTHQKYLDKRNEGVEKEIFYEYNDDGKLIRKRYSGGYEIWYEYQKGRLFKEMDSEGNKAFHFYDVDGNPCRKLCSNSKDQIIYDTDFKGKEVWYGYDDKGEQTYKINKRGEEYILKEGRWAINYD